MGISSSKNDFDEDYWPASYVQYGGHYYPTTSTYYPRKKSKKKKPKHEMYMPAYYMPMGYQTMYPGQFYYPQQYAQQYAPTGQHTRTATATTGQHTRTATAQSTLPPVIIPMQAEASNQSAGPGLPVPDPTATLPVPVVDAAPMSMPEPEPVTVRSATMPEPVIPSLQGEPVIANAGATPGPPPPRLMPEPDNPPLRMPEPRPSIPMPTPDVRHIPNEPVIPGRTYDSPRSSIDGHPNPLPVPPREAPLTDQLISATALTTHDHPPHSHSRSHSHSLTSSPTSPNRHRNSRRERLTNPLPEPPQDVYGRRQFRELTEGLPVRSGELAKVMEGPLSPQSPTSAGSGVGRMFRDLFRSLTSSHEPNGYDDVQDRRERGRGRGREGRDHFRPARLTTVPFYEGRHRSTPNVLPTTFPTRMTTYPTMVPQVMIPQPQPATPLSPAGSLVPFDRLANNTGFTHISPHRIFYKKKLYPTALHLYEAFKYMGHRPDLAEKVRTTERVVDVIDLTERLKEFVRPDWAELWRDKMHEALYMKFRQHSDLRAQLMETGSSDLVFSDPSDNFWGGGPEGRGLNTLGKILTEVRDRLRAEGGGH